MLGAVDLACFGSIDIGTYMASNGDLLRFSALTSLRYTKTRKRNED
jgi:hypothetical protein